MGTTDHEPLGARAFLERLSTCNDVKISSSLLLKARADEVACQTSQDCIGYQEQP
jgi:hypothetical protein